MTRVPWRSSVIVPALFTALVARPTSASWPPVQGSTTHRLAGTVTKPFGAPAVGVRVSVAPAGTASGEELWRKDRTAQTDARGRFAISGLAPGNYEVTALNTSAAPSAGQISLWSVGRADRSTMEPPLWAKLQVVIAGRDELISLVLQQGVNISGQLVFDGTQPNVLEVSRQRISVRNLASIVGPPSIQTEPTGKFQLMGVIPGHYEVTYIGGPVAGRTWWLRSATADGVDVRDAPMEVRAGGDIRALVLTLTDHPSRLTGTVSGVVTSSALRRAVAVFPVDPARRTSTVRVSQIPLTKDGTFRMINLPDGEYFVTSVMSLDGNWKEPAALDRLATGATRVTIAAGKETTCRLRGSEGS